MYGGLRGRTVPGRAGVTSRTHIAPLQGLFWRSVFIGQEAGLLAPARAPQGRWHHSNQRALYLSATPEGCRVALKAYLTPDDPPRGIYPIDVVCERVIDLRRQEVRDHLGVTLGDIHSFWATLHAKGQRPPTWHLSDRLRGMGLDGLLTPSRSRPDLTHLTVFRWNEGGSSATAHRAGDPEAF